MYRDSRAGEDDDILSSMQNSMWQGEPALSYLVSSLQVLSRPCSHDAGSRGGGQGIGLLYVITVARSLHISYFPGTTSGIVELLH